MADNNHMFTDDFKRLSRDLSRKGVRRPGVVALKKMGIEKAVKRKYHDEYLEKQMREG